MLLSRHSKLRGIRKLFHHMFNFDGIAFGFGGKT